MDSVRMQKLALEMADAVLTGEFAERLVQHVFHSEPRLSADDAALVVYVSLCGAVLGANRGSLLPLSLPQHFGETLETALHSDAGRTVSGAARALEDACRALLKATRAGPRKKWSTVAAVGLATASVVGFGALLWRRLRGEQAVPTPLRAWPVLRSLSASVVVPAAAAAGAGVMGLFAAGSARQLREASGARNSLRTLHAAAMDAVRVWRTRGITPNGDSRMASLIRCERLLARALGRLEA